MLTAALICGAAPPGSTVTLQLDADGEVIAFWVRQPDPAKRGLWK